ncbi:MAG: C4-dicarboxylate ABC transporter, partial [Betaproteobacteria bacterium]|nr:C4-dicarboxylate ABC transporter [Betaproteobacteria bacterium]
MNRFTIWMRRAAALALLAALLPGLALAQTHRMRLQTVVPASADEFKLLQEFSKRMEAMTNGRLKIEVLADGAV